MSSFDEGCVVLLRSTQLLYTIVRRDREAELLLLTPSDKSNGASPTNSPTGGKRPRTRWAFEHMVDHVESKTIEIQEEEPQARDSVSDDPTPYARRAAKLDTRVEIRRHKKRGRGLFALRNIPAGTEVMRVPAAAAVSLHGKGSCSGCLLTTAEVGSLKACPGCSLRFCARCKDAGTARGAKGVGVLAPVHSSAMCELTKEFFEMCATSRGATGGPDFDSLRLLADVVVKRKAGMIEDEEWDVLISLESHDNKAGSMSLARRVLDNCVRLFKRVVDIDVSQEDVQTMYRRITRNVYAVSPNLMKMGGGSVQGLFPFGALANHSCVPNTFFHCVADPSPSVDGPPAIKQVLRTICEVKAGDELCNSYLCGSAAVGNVQQRRGLLEGWGFRCTCERCKGEDVETKRFRRDPTPTDEAALRYLTIVEQISYFWQRTGARALNENSRQLEEAVRFYTCAAEQGLSWVLRDILAFALSEATEIVGVSDYRFRFVVCGYAADALSRMHQPAEITYRHQQYLCSTKITLSDLGTSQPRALELFQKSGRKVLHDAELLEELYYGTKGTFTKRVTSSMSKERGKSCLR